MVDKKEINEIDLRRNILFSKTLDYYSVQKNISRSQIAKRCGLDITCFNKSKMPVGRWIKLGTFFKICDALDIEPQEFIDMMNIINTQKEERE